MSDLTTTASFRLFLGLFSLDAVHNQSFSHHRAFAGSFWVFE